MRVYNFNLKLFAATLIRNFLCLAALSAGALNEFHIYHGST